MEKQSRRLVRPLGLTLIGLVWTALTFATCSTVHLDPTPGAVDFDPAGKAAIDLYSLVTITGISSRTADVVMLSLFTAGVAMFLSGIAVTIRHHR